MQDWVSVYRFSQMAGCDKTTVEKAITLGHLEDAVAKNPKGNIRIDPVAGRANWSRNWADTGNATPKLREFLKIQAAPVVAPVDDKWKRMTVSEARRIRESSKAQTEELILQQRLGQLVRIEDVRAAQFALVQVIRRELEVLPSQIGPSLGLDHKGQALLETEIGKRLERLADLEGIDFKPTKRK